MSSVVATDQIVSPSQFGLRSLFLWLTAAAVLLAPAYLFGGAYLFSVGLSTAMVMTCIRSYGNDRRGRVIIVAIGWGAIAFVLAMVALVFLAHAFFNVILCILLVACRPNRKVFAVASVVLMLLVYGYVVINGAAYAHEMMDAKRRYPLESLNPRLAFERKSSTATSKDSSHIQLASTVDHHLIEQDEQSEYGYRNRAWALRELHENMQTEFARAAGFGISRMPVLRPSMLDLDSETPLTVPWPIVVTVETGARNELFSTHRRVVENFTSTDRMGYVRSRDEVAGFKSHRTTEDVWWRDRNPQTANWQVVRLELVSLLRHETPCVYVADNLPAMDQLDNVPQRDLDSFETDALPRLSTNEDIVVQVDAKKIRMLGSLRASSKCLDCHEGSRGKLLGAFSYIITSLK